MMIYQRFIQGCTRVLLLGMLLVPAAPAVANFQPTSETERIAYLQGRLAQLRLQLAALSGNGVDAPSAANDTLKVKTLSAGRVTENSVQLIAVFELGTAKTAEVWFEYGYNQGLIERTSRFTRRSSGVFRYEESGIKTDSDLKYRAVIQDQFGNIKRGEVVSVSTGRSSFSSSRGSSFSGLRYPGGGGGSSRTIKTEDIDYELPLYIETDSPTDISADRAQLSGYVDMGDVADGVVFFILGEDRDEVNDVDDDYDRLIEIDQYDEEFRPILLNARFNGKREFSSGVRELEDEARYYYRLCVEHLFDDGDLQLSCGKTVEFRTQFDYADEYENADTVSGRSNSSFSGLVYPSR